MQLDSPPEYRGSFRLKQNLSLAVRDVMAAIDLHATQARRLGKRLTLVGGSNLQQ
jgi:hypothetical protein